MDPILNLGADKNKEPAFVAKTTDPLILPQPYASPTDYAGQYPTLLDPLEVLDLCEELSVYRAIPQQSTELSTVVWRELTSLAFTSGAIAVSFRNGECPEEYTHDGSNHTAYMKDVGAKKSLSESDMKDSMAKAGQSMGAINALLGAFPAGAGLPGGDILGSFQRQAVAGVKAKEIRLAETLVLNGIDRLMVVGNSTNNALEFDGIESLISGSCGHIDQTNISGTITAAGFDRFLSESCAKPTTLFGHPAAMQELLSAYFQLGFAGSQLINFQSGNRITPGYNFASAVNTGIGTLGIVADNNFTRVAVGSTFQSHIYALRMQHNGEPLVYNAVQFPLQWKDLAPGCTAISFMIWARMVLIIKACCAHGRYGSTFTGNIVTTCTTIG
jgi:hypothetical protein